MKIFNSCNSNENKDVNFLLAYECLNYKHE